MNHFEENREFDVLIIGGGIIGLSIARAIRRKSDLRVLILEKNPKCGTEASNAAAGMLAPQAEADRADDFFRFCTESRNLYPRFAEELKAETGIDIELDQIGTLYLAFTEQDTEELERRFTWQTAAGLPVEKLSTKEILELEPNISPKVSGGLRFPLDWQANNRLIISALTNFAAKNDIEILNETEVLGFKTKNNGLFEFESKKGVFYAKKAVFASGAWNLSAENEKSGEMKTKVKPIRGQMFSVKSAKKEFSHVIYSCRGYLVPRRDNRLLIGATTENVGFERKITPLGLLALTTNATEISAKIGEMEIIETWCGFRPKSADGLPILGEFPANSGLFYATGHYRNGILLAPLTAEIIAEKIVHKRESEFLQIFNPHRFYKKAASVL